MDPEKVEAIDGALSTDDGIMAIATSVSSIYTNPETREICRKSMIALLQSRRKLMSLYNEVL
jgi:hypothetical protein